MPYVRFVRTREGVSVYKRLKSGRVIKAFTSKGRSVAKARRTARIRASHTGERR